MAEQPPDKRSAERPARPRPDGGRRLRLGAEAEAIAEAHLHAAGLRTVARNWRGIGRYELDLIMRDGDIAVIVEVRAQDGARRGFGGHPAYTVGPTKQRRVQTAALYWQRSERRMPTDPGGWQPSTLRFDVVTLVRGPDGAWDLRWFKRAF